MMRWGEGGASGKRRQTHPGKRSSDSPVCSAQKGVSPPGGLLKLQQPSLALSESRQPLLAITPATAAAAATSRSIEATSMMTFEATPDYLLAGALLRGFADSYKTSTE